MYDVALAEVAATKLSSAMDADVLFYNGEITFKSSGRFIDLICARSRKKKLILILVTPGGEPDAAFKIGRSMQAKYDEISVFVPGWCKSAGTLIALAANAIYIGDRGELGPLDIQIAKSDEILEMGSGLTVDSAMKSLETTAAKMFLNLLLTIRRDTGGSITTRTAAELASTMVVKLLDPIYRQIDPMKIGENSRAMNITKSYGTRLSIKSGILKGRESLDFLVSAYPNHGFVIDRAEAKLLFTKVLEPTAEMLGLTDVLKEAALTSVRISSDGSPIITFLSSEAALKEPAKPKEPVKMLRPKSARSDSNAIHRPAPPAPKPKGIVASRTGSNGKPNGSAAGRAG
ncbi:ATP-dependent Clp protease proteolytic subunit [Bradyrhizobium erythrophlei]|uniref:SDH family Clp fold serine proteinase n=1 Tax=Bradyrhizobium erythrophlei TaxID=1437360 RepID=UPI0035E54C62